MTRSRSILLLLLIATSCKPSRTAPVFATVSPSEQLAAFKLTVRLATQAAGGRISLATEEGEVFLTAPPDYALRRIASLGRNGLFRLDHEPPTPSPSPTLSGDAPLVTGLAFSDDGQALLLAGGRHLLWWHAPTGALIGQLVGPDLLTGGIFEAGGQAALFSTMQGHVFRWAQGQTEATALNDFACPALPARVSDPALPAAAQCPHGTRVQLPDGRPVCAYAVNHLVRHGAWVARACREGTLALLHTTTHARYAATVGAVTALAVYDPDTLLVGRTDTQLRLYSVRQGKVLRSFPEQTIAHAVAISPSLAATAHERRVILWHWPTATRLHTQTLPKPAVWIDLRESPPELRLLLRDGQLLRQTLTIAP